MKILSKETALRIWSAHREIAAANVLRADAQEVLKKHTPDPVEDWQQHLELGIGTSCSSRRILKLGPELGIQIIDAHIVKMERELEEASEAARIELS